MSETKNLVKEYLLENKIIDMGKYFHSFYYEDVEWLVFKDELDSILYLSYELTEEGLGYAFFIKVQCKQFKYDIKSYFHSKSFTNSTTGEWEDCPENLKNKLLSDTMEYFKIF